MCGWKYVFMNVVNINKWDYLVCYFHSHSIIHIKGLSFLLTLDHIKMELYSMELRYDLLEVSLTWDTYAI